MLKNFNNLLKNIILEQVTEDNDDKYIKLVYHCNEFYNRYLADLAEDHNIGITKQRNNVFLAIGTFKDIISYFDHLKVDNMFMEKPEEFQICAPMYSFNDPEYEHRMQRGELYPQTSNQGVITTHDVDNKVRSTIFGKWFDFYENEKKGIKLLKLYPKKFKKYIKEIQKKYDCKDEDIIYIEFSVNCEDWKNNIFEDMAEFRTEDDINSFVSNDNDKRNIDDDFDYTQKCVVPKSNDDSHRKALKDIKKTEKTYKENKIK